MNVIGIVCEYNPFHLGHLYHLEKSREMAGEDAAVVCVMSGDFVQRGEAALWSKFARAEAACRCGADLVVELPLPWALASAEGFARGAVSLLGRLGATHLSFGSEAGETECLSALARMLLREEITGEIKDLLHEQPLLSFAAARQLVLEKHMGETGKLLAEPNNILAVEYLKAIDSLELDIRPLTVKRMGSGHDETGEGPGPKSASELRQRLAQGEGIDAWVPPAAAQVFARERAQGREIRDKAPLETAMLSRLRVLDEESFHRLPDAGQGLGLRLARAAQEEPTMEAVLAATGTRRYARSRLRRMCLCACLGLREGMSAPEPPYARVLAANARGRVLLREVKAKETIPLLTKPAAVREMPEDCQKLFALGTAAHDFYVLGYPAAEQRRGGEDWRTGPVILN